MRKFLLNRVGLLMVFISFSGWAIAGTIEGGSHGDRPQFYNIDLVDNKNNVVVINDFEYHLKLNTKITKSGAKLNRYALKVGQKVLFTSSFRGKKHYINSIIILPN